MPYNRAHNVLGKNMSNQNYEVDFSKINSTKYNYWRSKAKNRELKITGILHNCALNCGLPTILDVIIMLADWEKLKLLDENKSGDGVYPNYDLIKTIFFEFYLEGIEFSWVQFSNFLNERSFLEIQIILAPILREFIVRKIKDSDTQTQQRNLNTIGAECHYPDLEAQEVEDLFYNQLGIIIDTSIFYPPESAYFQQQTNGANFPKSSRPSQLIWMDNVVPLVYKYEHFENHIHESLGDASRNQSIELDNLDEQLKLFTHQVTSCQGCDFNILKEYVGSAYLKLHETLFYAESVSYATKIADSDSSPSQHETDIGSEILGLRASSITATKTPTPDSAVPDVSGLPCGQISV